MSNLNKFKIGVLVAMPIEARCFLPRSIQIGDTLPLKSNIFLHIGGVGAQCAQQGAEHLLKQGVNALISWGCAAGLNPALRPGQIMIPEKIIDHHQNEFLTDNYLREQFLGHICHKKLTINSAPMLQSAQLVTSVAGKQQLFTQFKTSAVDMESASIANIAQQANLSFIAVRAIADSATMVLPFWLTRVLNNQGEVRPLHFLKEFCHHPHTWMDFLHLSRGFSAAKSSLKLAANLLGWSAGIEDQR